MATALTLLNNVLRGLRRDILEHTSTSDAYHILLVQFLNIVKRRIESAWDWEALRQTVTVTLSASVQTYSLTASGPADVDVTENSRLLYEWPNDYGRSWQELSLKSAGALPQVFDVTDASEYRLREVTWEQFERLRLTDADDTTTRPEKFALRRTGGYFELGVWPMPAGTRTLKVRFVIPQADIPVTYMTNYTISIPNDQVWLAALAIALDERGEQVSGRLLSTIQKEADDAHYVAVTRERTGDDNLAAQV